MKYQFSPFLLLIFFLGGCSHIGSISVSDEREALRLVDEGTQFLRARKLEEADAAFKVAYELSASSAALDGLGCVAFAREDFTEAEAYFLKAYENDASYNDSLANLALLYEMQGFMNKARDLFHRALEVNPQDYRARNNYAVFLHSELSSAEDMRQHSSQIKQELLKTQVLNNDPIIRSNILKVVNEEKW